MRDADYDHPWRGLDIERVVSIDFGSYGYAAAFCQTFMGASPRMVNLRDPNNKDASSDTNKDITAILLDKDTKEVIAIGSRAKGLYMEQKHNDKYVYFDHFKTILYS